MPNTDTAFLCWMATKTPWRENWKDRGSPVSALICLTMSSSRDDGSGPNTPEVSIVKGAKWWLSTDVGILFCLLPLCLVCNCTGLLGSKSHPDVKGHRHLGMLHAISGPDHTSKASPLPHLSFSHSHMRCLRGPDVKVLWLMPVPS